MSNNPYKDYYEASKHRNAELQEKARKRIESQREADSWNGRHTPDTDYGDMGGGC